MTKEKKRTKYPTMLGNSKRYKHTMGKQGERERIFETVMTETFLKFMSNIKPLTRKAQRTQTMINTNTITSRYIIFKLQKTKDEEKNLVRRQKNRQTYREAKTAIKIVPLFSFKGGFFTGTLADTKI